MQTRSPFDDAEALEPVGEPADVAVELAVREDALVLVALPLPDQGDLVPPPALEVPVQAVVRDVRRAPDEPAGVRMVPFEHAVPAPATSGVRGRSGPRTSPGPHDSRCTPSCHRRSRCSGPPRDRACTGAAPLSGAAPRTSYSTLSIMIILNKSCRRFRRSVYLSAWRTWFVHRMVETLVTPGSYQDVCTRLQVRKTRLYPPGTYARLPPDEPAADGPGHRRGRAVPARGLRPVPDVHGPGPVRAGPDREPGPRVPAGARDDARDAARA